jgi:hypothetical protein
MLVTLCNGQLVSDTRWIRETIADRAVSPQGMHVDLAIIGEAGKVTGELTVANVQTSTYKPIVRVIAGHRFRQSFWPAVTLQVGDTHTGPWQTIASSRSKSKDRIIIKPGEVAQRWLVGLDPFASYIGKQSTGRIVLSDGDGAVFELSDLVPPK